MKPAREVAYDKRLQEITDTVAAATDKFGALPPHICLVPVRMAESWLLFDESAIRQAAGRPHGKVALGIPKGKPHDTIANAKELLLAALKQASELTGRKLKKFRPDGLQGAVADYIGDYSPLRKLQAFKDFEAEVKRSAEVWRASQADGAD